MKKTILFLTLFSLSALSATAQTVGRTNIPPAIKFTWNAAPTSVAGYNLYYGGSTGTYTNKTQVAGASTTNVTLTNFVSGDTYFCNLTAYNSNAVESPYTGEISITVPALPAAPTGFQAVSVQ